MGTYKNNRTMRILGDRLEARAHRFAEIHPLLADIHARFMQQHRDLANAVQCHLDARCALKDARRLRTETARKCRDHYR